MALRIAWFPNGMAAVFDERGNQVPEFQGRHSYTLQKLKDAGIHWTDVTEFGIPITQEKEEHLFNLYEENSSQDR
jgi:hypothetical protein